jgi:hypothetical protein
VTWTSRYGLGQKVAPNLRFRADHGQTGSYQFEDRYQQTRMCLPTQFNLDEKSPFCRCDSINRREKFMCSSRMTGHSSVIGLGKSSRPSGAISCGSNRDAKRSHFYGWHVYQAQPLDAGTLCAISVTFPCNHARRSSLIGHRREGRG